MPTVNGFDEFFGNLYHLDAEEEPEMADYPEDPADRVKLVFSEHRKAGTMGLWSEPFTMLREAFPMLKKPKRKQWQ